MVNTFNRRKRVSNGTIGALLVSALLAIVIGGCGGGGGGTSSSGGFTTSTTSTNTTATNTTSTNTTSTTSTTATTDGTTAGVLQPDRIYYSEQTADSVNVRYINPNGSGDSPYQTLPAGFDALAINSANNTRYFAYRSSVDADLGIYSHASLAADGATQLVAPTYAFVGSMQLSNDGTTLYYVAARTGDEQGTLYKLTLGGSNTPVALDSAESANLNAANNKIVYAKSPTGSDTEIFVRGTSPGGTPTQLTNNTAYETSPQWNKAGTRIVFSRSPDGGASDIYTMAADGTDEQRITNTADVDEQSPSFNQGGDMISFVAFSSDSTQTGLWRASSSGTDQGKVLLKADTQIVGGTYWTGSNGRGRFNPVSFLDRLRKKGQIKP